MLIESKKEKLDQPENPRYYGVDHDEWRPGQGDAVEWVRNQENKFLILNAPTGSGKSAIAAAQSVDGGKTIGVCRTKILQSTVYSEYNFEVVYGKGNYSCEHEQAAWGATANDCVAKFNGKSMHHCGERCGYPIAVRNAIMHDKISLNYAKYLLDRKWSEIERVLVLDEAHLLSQITLEKAGISVHEHTRAEWHLPEFPVIRGRGNAVLLGKSSRETPIDKAKDWLQRARLIMDKHVERLFIPARRDSEKRKMLRKAENLQRKLQTTYWALDVGGDSWYVRSGGKQVHYRGKQIPGIVAKPLTARHHFKRYFGGEAEKIMMMSATIGKQETFVKELGIDEYAFHQIENQWGPESRPVYDLKAPRMNAKSTEKDYQEQARIIAEGIQSCPLDWSGVVHVTRIKEAGLMMGRLAKYGVAEERLWTPRQYSSTDEQMGDWISYKQRVPNALAITYSWFEGVDLGPERINITAKVPFPYWGDEYERERANYDRAMYSQRAAWDTQQSQGRTRRGRIGDYDTPTEINGFNAIADGNWTRIKSYLDQDFLDAIVEWK